MTGHEPARAAVHSTDSKVTPAGRLKPPKWVPPFFFLFPFGFFSHGVWIPGIWHPVSHPAVRPAPLQTSTTHPFIDRPVPRPLQRCHLLNFPQSTSNQPPTPLPPVHLFLRTSPVTTLSRNVPTPQRRGAVLPDQMLDPSPGSSSHTTVFSRQLLLSFYSAFIALTIYLANSLNSPIFHCFLIAFTSSLSPEAAFPWVKLGSGIILSLFSFLLLTMWTWIFLILNQCITLTTVSSLLLFTPQSA